MDNKVIEEVDKILVKYNQTSATRLVNELEAEEKIKLYNQLAKIDFENLDRVIHQEQLCSRTSDLIEPIGYVDRAKLKQDEIERYTKIGDNILQTGKFAFVTMAGGQGTRLGHNGPKGTYMLDINPAKSLFEIMCDRLKKAHDKYGKYIPWYIMTSRENNKQTIEFFETNKYFGYPKEYISFFIQGELPMVDTNGNAILENKYTVKEAADGHGGVFSAMDKAKVMLDMKARSIKWIFIGGIDNVLLNMVDPLFIGMAEYMGVEFASKSVVKLNPSEKVGVFCNRNGRPSVVEYSEITEEMAQAKDNNGELLFGEAHILCNLFSINALEKISNEKLPYHRAFKKCEYLDENGKLIIPEEPNAYKFETFIFDAFSKYDNVLILRCKREDEFAPIKNKEGVDSPATAKALYEAYWKTKIV